MSDFTHRTWAEIDVAAIRENYTCLRSRLSSGCRCMAIVKADAYGHGALPVAAELSAAGVDWFGVSNIDEALELRRGGIDTPILILGYTPPELAGQLAEHHITQAVLDSDYAARLETAAAKANVTVQVHIKVDTGMSRVGFFVREVVGDCVDAIAGVCALPHLNAEGIFTHFALADEQGGDAVTHQQFSRFSGILTALEQRGITFKLRHCCNSAAALRFPKMHLDMVRAGIILYGAPPSSELTDAMPLRPAMVLKTVIALIKTVPAGCAVSYGHTFVTTRPTVLATLPIGYADGLSRLAGGHFSVSVGGQKAALVGRVCMDQCMIDVTDIPHVSNGMAVTVFGTDDVSVDAFAAACQTIPYESLCGIGKRVPRVYLQNNV